MPGTLVLGTNRRWGWGVLDGKTGKSSWNGSNPEEGGKVPGGNRLVRLDDERAVDTYADDDFR